MDKEELQRHREALDLVEKNYDENTHSVIIHSKNDAYHTKLANQEVHDIRGSVTYAVALLYGEREADYPRAEALIEKVLSLQDIDPDSNTFGLWSYFEEEPLEKMDAPDRNWADFIGKQLLEILYVHKDKLNGSLIPKIEFACRCACESIIRRNEGVQYTNIAATDTFVTILTGELLGEPRLIEYGKKKMERYLAFAKYNGEVFEYNSPCYTLLITRDAATFLRFVKDPQASAYAQEINHMAWSVIANHFRADMLQLSGPQSRAYFDYLSDSNMYDIELACNGQVCFDCKKRVTIETFWTKASCPPEFYGYFTGEKKPISHRKLIMHGFNYPFFAFSQVATTYHGEHYTVGSYNREELWNQRRPYIAYIAGKGKPYCLRLRCLHDGYDFSSAQLHCVQQEKAVLGIVNIASDRGDTHIGLDSAKEAEYEELAVTFELEGEDMDAVSVEENGHKILLDVNGVKFYLNILAAKFDDYKIKYELNKSENKLIFSTIFYRGAKTKINLSKLEGAYLCFTACFEEDVISSSCRELGELVEGVCVAGEYELRVQAQKNVLPFMNMMVDDWQWVNGKRLERISE